MMALYLGKNIPAGGIPRLTQLHLPKIGCGQNSSCKNFPARKRAA